MPPDVRSPTPQPDAKPAAPLGSLSSINHRLPLLSRCGYIASPCKTISLVVAAVVFELTGYITARAVICGVIDVLVRIHGDVVVAVVSLIKDVRAHAADGRQAGEACLGGSGGNEQLLGAGTRRSRNRRFQRMDTSSSSSGSTSADRALRFHRTTRRSLLRDSHIDRRRTALRSPRCTE